MTANNLFTSISTASSRRRFGKVPAHVQYWQTAGLDGYTGGPFSDRTGGLITFSASNLEEATQIIQRDPFVQEGLIDQNWIKEWLPE